MAKVSSDTGAQLRFEFYKSVQTFGLATLGGEVTLLHSLFKDVPDKRVGYVAIASVTLACLFILSAKEVQIRRLDPLPITRHKLFDKFHDRIEMTSPTAERIFGHLSGALYGLGLVLFIFFVSQH